MDNEDWKRLEELVHQAGGVASTPSSVPDVVRADAMSFHTLGLAILDINKQIRSISARLAQLDTSPNKPILYGAFGEKLNG